MTDTTAGSKQIMDNKSKSIGEMRNLKEITVKRKQVSEEEVFFRVSRDIPGLDIILSLQSLGCYMLPYRSMFPEINFARFLQKLARRKTTFEELLMQRKFKKIFGQYGYKILNLCFISNDEFVSESRHLEDCLS